MGNQSTEAGRTATPKQEHAQAASVRQPRQCAGRSVAPLGVTLAWGLPAAAACECLDSSAWTWAAEWAAGPIEGGHDASAASAGNTSPVTSTRISKNTRRRKRASTIADTYWPSRAVSSSAEGVTSETSHVGRFCLKILAAPFLEGACAQS